MDYISRETQGDETSWPLEIPKECKMGIKELQEILKDEKGYYYVYYGKDGYRRTVRLKITNCLKCGKEMYQYMRNGKGVQKYCGYDCRPYAKGFKRNKEKINMDGLLLGRGWNKGMKNHLSEETIKKMSLAHIGKIGEKASNWKGGYKTENYRIRRRKEYELWRKKVYKKDNYTCQHCLKKGVYLNAHHIKSFRYYPELRYDINNGITLCIECHKREHKKLRMLKVG